MSGFIGLFIISKIIYNEYESYEKLKNLRLISFKERLSKIDINYVNSLIKIVKKEMKEMKESSYKSLLSLKERKVIIEYCKTLLNGYNSGYLKDFSTERRDYCNEIIKYCHDPSGYRIIYVFLN